MSRLLQNYVTGNWYSAPDEGSPVYSAVDGSEIARVSSTGSDYAAAVDYARTMGGESSHQNVSALNCGFPTAVSGFSHQMSAVGSRASVT